MPSSTAEIAQIEKLIGSLTLHGSESLCKLLRYLAERAMDQPGIPVKEYQIATEVFGRPRNFDPRLDSTVRVQTGRLRAKLQEYYSTKEATPIRFWSRFRRALIWFRSCAGNPRLPARQ